MLSLSTQLTKFHMELKTSEERIFNKVEGRKDSNGTAKKLQTFGIKLDDY